MQTATKVTTPPVTPLGLEYNYSLERTSETFDSFLRLRLKDNTRFVYVVMLRIKLTRVWYYKNEYIR